MGNGVFKGGGGSEGIKLKKSKNFIKGERERQMNAENELV